MGDVYAAITEADEAVQQQIADVLELRASDLQQRAMLEDYLADVPISSNARVLEIGCGTGAVVRAIAARYEVGEVVGIDPSPVLLGRAMALTGTREDVSFVEGDGRALPFADGEFDVVVCHTVLCHVPEPERVLAEAARVTAPGGRLAVFDGDYATTTVAIADNDPLQRCADAAMAALVHDPWLVRRLPGLVRGAGYEVVRTRSHGYVETVEPQYMFTLVDRGVTALEGDGRIGSELASALRAEARDRADAGRFFGHIAYASVIGRRT